MVPCRACGETVADKARTCPKCGCGLPSQKNYREVMTKQIPMIFVLGIVALFVIMWFMGKNGYL